MSRDATPRRICPRTARRPLLDLPSPLTAIPAVGIRLSRRRPRRRLSAARHYSLCGSPVPHFLSPRPKSGGLSKHHHPSPALDSLPSRTKKARREDPTEGPRRWNHVSVPPLCPIAASGRKPDLVRFFCQPTAPCTRQLAVDSHALCCRRLQRGVCCVGPLATGSKRLLAS